MTLAQLRVAPAINIGSDVSVLRTFGMEGVSLTLWERTLPETLASTLDALPLDRLPRLRAELAVGQVADAVRAACDEAKTGECAGPLTTEIERLADHAARIFASPLLKLRIDLTEGQPCPKWHVDAVPGRLLCTLRGPGTQYGPAGENGAPRSVHQMTRGSVGIFRGLLWPGQEVAAILHRSPPREAGGARLLVVIDPVYDAETCR